MIRHGPHVRIPQAIMDGEYDGARRRTASCKRGRRQSA
jgi:hypothetical protein